MKRRAVPAAARGENRRVPAVLAASLCCAIAGCTADRDRAVVVVAAASSLGAALTATCERYSGEEGGGEVLVHTASSGALMRQIERGAPVDLFVSASPRELDALERSGRLVHGTRRPIATNRLVLVVPRGGPRPSSTGELADPRYARIAVGDPSIAPVGRYAREALASAGLWDSLQERLVLAADARQLREYVARGEVSAALIYASDARVLGDRVVPGPELPPGSYAPIVYEAALIDDAPSAERARKLLRWLGSAGAREVLAGHGFGVEP